MFKKELYTLMSIYLLIIFGMIASSTATSTVTTNPPHKITQDTVIIPKDTFVNVKDKTALIIGDSHSANNTNGWQKVLCDKTGMKMINASVGGKTTYWMLETALYKINNSINYCFVYGGANDMYSSGIKPVHALRNIQGIVRMCNGRGIKCYVITGFDPEKCTRTTNPNYAGRYAKLQKMMLDSIKGATVIDTRVVERTDCWDALCHMAPSGHRKIAEKIIHDGKFRTIK
jgi:hypothetical protein